MQARTVLISASLLVAMTRVADALDYEPILGAAPARGAIDVPTNAVLTADTTFGPVHLEDGDGNLVATTNESVAHRLVRLRPVEELLPDHTYSIMVTNERARELNLYFGRSFHTGLGPDTSPPPAISIVNPKLSIRHFERPNYACGPIDLAELDLGITEATRSPTYLVTVHGEEPTLVLDSEWDEFATRQFSRGQTACMTLQPRDLAGNLGPSHHVCVPANDTERGRARMLLAAVLLSIVASVSAVVWVRRRHRRRYIVV